MRLYRLTDRLSTIFLCSRHTIRHLSILRGLGLPLPSIAQTTDSPTLCTFCRFE